MTDQQDKLWCLVPAAGIGSRFGSNKPKQYSLLAGKPLLQITLECLSQINFQAIVVALHCEDKYWCELENMDQSNVETIIGGEHRFLSVLAGLNHLEGRADDNDWVLVHDVARPCIVVTDIQHLIAEIINRPEISGGLLVAPVSDTIKQVNQSLVSNTLDRNNLYAALTPQMFRYQELKKALRLMLEHNKTPTDEASAMEYIGAPVAIVQGRRDNIKITQLEDLAIAEAIICYQQSNGER